MKLRTGPDVGYATNAKNAYRLKVWSTLADRCPVRPCHANTLLMPAREGLEIDVARSRGFSPYRMWILDRNPAVVAVHKRRWPAIQTVGRELIRAEEKIPGASLHAANIDLCGNVSSELTWFGIRNTARLMAEDSVIAVTVARGRERMLESGVTWAEDIARRHQAEPLTGTDMTDRTRLLNVGEFLRDAGRHRWVMLIRTFSYCSSGRITMLVGIYWLHNLRSRPQPGENSRYSRMIAFALQHGLVGDRIIELGPYPREEDPDFVEED